MDISIDTDTDIDSDMDVAIYIYIKSDLAVSVKCRGPFQRGLGLLTFEGS